MDPSADYSDLIELLKERGHSQEEIDKIIEHVRVYDEQTRHDSLMDSIGSGQVNLDALINDALKD